MAESLRDRLQQLRDVAEDTTPYETVELPTPVFAALVETAEEYNAVREHMNWGSDQAPALARLDDTLKEAE